MTEDEMVGWHLFGIFKFFGFFLPFREGFGYTTILPVPPLQDILMVSSFTHKLHHQNYLRACIWLFPEFVNLLPWICSKLLGILTAFDGSIYREQMGLSH